MAKRQQSQHLLVWGGVGVVVLGLILIKLIAANNAAYVPPVSMVNNTPPHKVSATSAVSTNANSAVPVQTKSSVVSVAEGLSSATRFGSLLESTGVSSLVSGTGPYTIFVPTDASLHAYEKIYGTLTTAAAKRLVEYHIVSGRAIDTDAISSGSVQALSRDYINFVAPVGGGGVRINSSQAIKTYDAKNGVVYLIDSVLVPPQQ